MKSETHAQDKSVWGEVSNIQKKKRKKELQRKVTRISNRQSMRAKKWTKNAKRREFRSMRMILNIYIYNKYFVFLCCFRFRYTIPYFFSFERFSSFHFDSRSYFSLRPLLLYKIQSKNISLFHIFFTVCLAFGEQWMITKRDEEQGID